MTEPPTTYDHPVFGHLMWDPEIDSWLGTRPTTEGISVRVVVTPCNEDRVGYINPASDLFGRAMTSERRILEDALKAELLCAYNDCWRNPDDAISSVAELAARLRCVTVEIHSSDAAPVVLWYGPADYPFGPFGRHDVVVTVGPEFSVRSVHLDG